MEKRFAEELKNAIPAAVVKADEMMSGHTTFRIGGPARYYMIPVSAEDIRLAVEMSKDAQIPYVILGNGSNVLVGDRGFEGLVIQLEQTMDEIEVEGTRLRSGSGAKLSKIAHEAAEHGLGDLAFAAGIPGTLGGAMVMNAGAYGGEMKDVIASVTVMSQDGRIQTLSNEEMGFGYRRSVIGEQDLIVLSAEFALEEMDPDVIREKMAELSRKRNEKQPLNFPSAGSTFKRPEGYFAGALIEEAGLRGYTVGGACVSEKHCGFVINKDGATAEDVRRVIRDVQERVLATSGVALEPEVKFLGEF